MGTLTEEIRSPPWVPSSSEPDMALPKSYQGCVEEIKSFLNGGMVGRRRLKQVLPSLFSYFGILTLESKATLLTECGLVPVTQYNDVTFYLKEMQALQVDFGSTQQDSDEAASAATPVWENILIDLPSCSSSSSFSSPISLGEPETPRHN